MNRYKNLLMVTLLLIALLTACQKDSSPPPSEGDASTAPPTESAAVTEELPSADPTESYTFPPLTPIPPSEDAKDWADNDITIRPIFITEEVTDENEWYLYAEASFPQLTGAPESVADYYQDLQQQFTAKAETLGQEAKRYMRDGSLDRMYTLNQQFQVECNSGGLISIRRIEELDQGGVHSTVSYYGDNFRVSDGRYLTMDDFFTVSRDEYLPILMAEVIKFIEPNEDEFNPYWREDLEVLFPYDCFCVCPSGLRLFFQTGTIGPIAMGPLAIEIGWDVLEGILSVASIEG